MITIFIIIYIGITGIDIKVGFQPHYIWRRVFGFYSKIYIVKNTKKVTHKTLEIHDSVLAYRLLNNANISESYKQLIRATLPELRFATSKKQLKRVFTKTFTKESIDCELSELVVKLESNDSSLKEEEIYFVDRKSNLQKKKSTFLDREYSKLKGKANNLGSCGRDNSNNVNNIYRGGNNSYNRNNTPQILPTDSERKISKCLVCGSVFHWVKDCPDSYETRPKGAFHKFRLQQTYTAFIEDSTENLKTKNS